MDEICSHLLVGNWTPPGGTRRRRSVDAAPGRVSLLSLFIAAHNESVLAPATTTAVTPTTHLNVTATPSPVSLVAAMFGDSVTRGLLPAVTVLGLFANSLTLVVIAGDRRCPALWRALRCLAVVVDVVLLTLLTLVIDVVAYFAHMSLDVLNSLAAVTGLCQFAQPWILYITATYIHCLLLDERHKVPTRRRVRCPLAQLIVMLVVGTVYFTLYVPPIRLLLYTNIPGHSTLCTLPLFDQWQLTVGQTAATDLFYYLCYDSTYALLVYLTPQLTCSHVFSTVTCATTAHTRSSSTWRPSCRSTTATDDSSTPSSDATTSRSSSELACHWAAGWHWYFDSWAAAGCGWLLGSWVDRRRWHWSLGGCWVALGIWQGSILGQLTVAGH